MNPDPGDWINWRRTLNGHGYSPLDQINRDSVRHLQLVWSWSTPPGTDEVTPLVHDGVMYVPSRSGSQALDAATGDFIWEHTRRRQSSAPVLASCAVMTQALGPARGMQLRPETTLPFAMIGPVL